MRPGPNLLTLLNYLLYRLLNNIHVKIINFDWLRAVQFKCNTSAKSATPVQLQIKILDSDCLSQSNHVK